MKKNVIKINEAQIRKIVSESIKHIVKENCGTPEKLTDELDNIYENLSGCIAELEDLEENGIDGLEDVISSLRFSTNCVGDLSAWCKEETPNGSSNFPLSEPYVNFSGQRNGYWDDN